LINGTVEKDRQGSAVRQSPSGSTAGSSVATPQLSELQVARRRRTNILLALGLAVLALAFFFSAMLIDFESMQ